MQNVSTSRVYDLLTLPRSAKKAIAIITDAYLCVITVWLAICFRFESWVVLSDYQWLAVGSSVALAIPLLTTFGFYHTVIRFAGKQTIIAALRAIGIYALIYSAIFTVYGFPLVPRTIGILQPLLLLICLALVRLLASQLLNTEVIRSHDDLLPCVLIYGAGSSGQQLAVALNTKGERRVIGFIDDNPSLQKGTIGGIPVYAPQDMVDISKTQHVREVILAMPSLARNRRTEIIKKLAQNRVVIRTMPNLIDLASGKITANDLRELDIGDLLGRDPVLPDLALMARTIADKVVMVTGAGGSIGGELCRQILALRPNRLVLVDSSEYALYVIQAEIEQLRSTNMNSPNLQVYSILANVRDASRTDELIRQFHPDTIFHTAAYKHVPLVEGNPAEGLQNNILGTYNVSNSAIANGVKDMVLISTDKAVRPTNVMGASKRLSELCLACLANRNPSSHDIATRFCIVRFGNVLGSSGSVLPKFRKQIEQGGPVTLTHPEITRYFMTIPEAAQLVIQASGLHSLHNHSCQIYLLDMGEPVKIIELAKLMIRLSGLTCRDESNPNGDIPIAITGLRPGEKLYEELLVSGTSKPTQHPKIHCAYDTGTSADEELLQKILDVCKLPPDIDRIEAALLDLDIGYTRAPLHAGIPLQPPFHEQDRDFH